ncbi:MAG: class I SAM-dependent methyltransferase, partial [Methanolinea sp.]|nr:class I SAM-dependent methyltransferase [Methanolinea sp.]
MTGSQDAWNRDYTRKGRMWAREQVGLPMFSPGTRVLEVGCGDGKTLRALLQEKPGSPAKGVPEIVALDFSREAVRLSKASIPGTSGISLLIADAAFLPFPGGSFDAVLLFHLLGHAASGLRKEIVREAVRVTRRGGRIYVRVFSAGDFRAGKGIPVEAGTYRRGTGILTHYFTADEVGRI